MPVELSDRARDYWDFFDFTDGRGLEVGPLHRTIVPRESADVRYVDVHDRNGLIAHYEGQPIVDPALIPEIDFHLIQDDGTVLSLDEATRSGGPYSWVMASHVIEHVPDVIGWLAQIAEVTHDDAALVLAVPDRRLCFDIHRPPTTVGQMLQAHLDGDDRPSVRAVYDYFSSVVHGDARDLWRGEVPLYAQRYHSMAEAHEHVQRTRAGTYVDSHVWVFTPTSFLEQIRELRLGGLTCWYVESLEPTPLDDLEFKVVLRRLPRDVDPVTAEPHEVRAEATRPDWVTEPTLEIAQLRSRVQRLEERLAQRKERIVSLRRAVDRSRSQAARARAELDAVHRSRRWQIAGAVARPASLARGLSRRLRA